MEVAGDYDDHQLRVDLNEIRNWARSKADSAYDMESSSSIRKLNSKPE